MPKLINNKFFNFSIFTFLYSSVGVNSEINPSTFGAGENTEDGAFTSFFTLHLDW